MTGRETDAAVRAMSDDELEQFMGEQAMFRSEFQEWRRELGVDESDPPPKKAPASSWVLVVIGAALVGLAVWKMGL